jgi:hypothetical protein
MTKTQKNTAPLNYGGCKSERIRTAFNQYKMDEAWPGVTRTARPNHSDCEISSVADEGVGAGIPAGGDGK